MWGPWKPAGNTSETDDVKKRYNLQNPKKLKIQWATLVGKLFYENVHGVSIIHKIRFHHLLPHLSFSRRRPTVLVIVLAKIHIEQIYVLSTIDPTAAHFVVCSDNFVPRYRIPRTAVPRVGHAQLVSSTWTSILRMQ